MAAGLAQLKVLEEENVFAKLEELGGELEEGIRSALKAVKLDYSFYRYGSMFCLFFTPRPVRNLDDARTSDLAHFARYFHALLDRGVYVAPSQFETGFLSAAHTREDLKASRQAVKEALAA
jgi:glutamate-1-semialdehyde 2,1-aminomutase